MEDRRMEKIVIIKTGQGYTGWFKINFSKKNNFISQ